MQSRRGQSFGGSAAPTPAFYRTHSDTVVASSSSQSSQVCINIKPKSKKGLEPTQSLPADTSYFKNKCIRPDRRFSWEHSADHLFFSDTDGSDIPVADSKALGEISDTEQDENAFDREIPDHKKDENAFDSEDDNKSSISAPDEDGDIDGLIFHMDGLNPPKDRSNTPE